MKMSIMKIRRNKDEYNEDKMEGSEYNEDKKKGR